MKGRRNRIVPLTVPQPYMFPIATASNGRDASREAGCAMIVRRHMAGAAVRCWR